MIASKDADIEDLKKRLVAAEKQLALEKEKALAKQLAEEKRSLTQDAEAKALTSSMDKLENEHAIQLDTAKGKLSELEKWTRHELVDLKALVEKHAAASDDLHHLIMQLAASEKQRAELKETHNRLKAEHDEWSDLIAALRRQIKETKDALELDTPKLLEIKNTVQMDTADRQEKLKTRVKLGVGAPRKGGALSAPAASGGKDGLEFGAMDLDGDGVLSKAEFQSKLRSMGWSLEEAEQTFKAMDRDGDGGILANEYAAFCQMEDKNLEFGTLNGIAKLRQQLADLQAQLAVMAGKDAEMEDLKKRLAAAEKQLAEEKLKTEELEANLKKTKVCAQGEGMGVCVG